ncbi:unnamed protein product [Paramecium octaurelia]|uniref:Uncharacterized protein n=1 Tax=Paramecium octaurelia TaxID=43137 RepID=A0A8S1YG45_PAROT|nr:unnamed protein product [Paramecium octaurelia]
MEGLVSTTDSIQTNCKFVTRLEKLKKLFDQSLQMKQENIIFQNCKNEIPQWVDLLNSYKEIEKAHNEFNLNNVGKMKKMDQSEIDLLNVVVSLYCHIHKLQPLLMDVFDWDQIGSILFNRHWKVCRSKWIENQATSIVDHPWSREEDSVLSQLYEKYAEQNRYNKWSLIAMEMSKICKQCRERWINKLNPQVERGPWYKEEEIKLLVAILNTGKKWSLISRRDFDNQRTENCLKNRFHTIIKRESSKFDKYKTQNQKQNQQKLSLEDETKLIEQIIQELKDESFLQQQPDQWNMVGKKYHISQSDRLLDIIDNSFQIAIIKKNKINEII